MLDADLLIRALLVAAVPELSPTPEIEGGKVGLTPTLRFHVLAIRAVSNSPGKPKAWTATLTLTVIAKGLSALNKACSDSYDAVWAWDDAFVGAGRAHPEIGYVSNISDISAFSRAPRSDVTASEFRQASATFSLLFTDK